MSSIALLLVLLAWRLVPGGSVPGVWLRIREELRRDLPNAADYRQMERGYYETLIESGRRLNALGDAPQPGTAERPERRDNIPITTMPFIVPVDDLREYVLKPNLLMDLWGVRWGHNSLGMRDREYTTVKPPQTFRIALVGDSIAAGWGVDDGQGFEPRWEQMLDERSRAAGGPAVEILNFAIPGSAPGQRWENFRRTGWATDPDVVLIEATLADVGWDEQRLHALLPRGLAWDAPQYRAGLAAAGLRPGWDRETYERGLRPFRWEILSGVYESIAADCRSRGVPCLWVLLPRVGEHPEPKARDRLIATARAAGFTRVIDLGDVYQGIDPATLAILPNDYHPNPAGHARLAERFDALLSGQPEFSRLGRLPRAAEGETSP
jgi:hypothetical protein